MFKTWHATIKTFAEIIGKSKQMNSQLFGSDKSINQPIKLDSFLRAAITILLFGFLLSFISYLFEFSKKAW